MKYILILCLLFCGCSGETVHNEPANQVVKTYKYGVRQYYGPYNFSSYETDSYQMGHSSIEFKGKDGKDIKVFGNFVVWEQ